VIERTKKEKTYVNEGCVGTNSAVAFSLFQHYWWWWIDDI